ncbi:MAG TPA: ankyrin repeat domain-containing protein [Bryobacteraceae bacterium]|jgi:ankyrin repeat protein|nr:ankyrin repeat domain-containing protein [Bryobacteraceae bacterium]
MRWITGCLLVTSIVLAQPEASKLDASLLAAAGEGKAASVRALLKQGANPNAVSAEGSTLTALMLASRGGHTLTVKALLDAGAKVNMKADVASGAAGVNEGVTALMLAAASGNPSTVQALLDRKADFDAKATYRVTADNGETRLGGSRPVLMHAASTPVLKLLAEHGADLRVTGGDGTTLLMHAAEHLDPEAVRYLLSKGLDPRAHNQKGQTALDLAKEAGKTGNAAVLEEALKH